MRKIIVLFALSSLLLSCEDIFEEDLSHEEVRIIAPADGVSVDAGTVMFLWEEVPGATSYRITVVSPEFEDAGIVVGDELLRNDSVTHHRSYACDLAPGDYQWSISALNSAYSTPRRISSLHVNDTPEEPETGGEDEETQEIGRRP